MLGCRDLRQVTTDTRPICPPDLQIVRLARWKLFDVVSPGALPAGARSRVTGAQDHPSGPLRDLSPMTD